jgi:predicted MPP superfamily phosphohydrolase
VKLALIHLSDIHIEDRRCEVLARAEKICATVNTLLPDVAGVIIAVTGDIAYSGTSEQYALALEFLERLRLCIQAKVPHVVVYTVTVPGNHDGQFKAETKARRQLIDSVVATNEVDESIVSIVVAPQAAYYEFEELIPHQYRSYSDALWKQHELTISGKKIVISALNASWMSQVPEEQGRLVFPAQKYEDQAKVSGDVKIVLLHHPLNWYCQSSYHPLREMCRTHYEIVMSGHEHTSAAILTHDLDFGANLILESGALWPHSHGDKSEFAVVTLDLETERFARVKFNWLPDKDIYAPVDGDAVWDSFVALPQRSNEQFSITANFRLQLEDAGATFTHPQKEKLSLSDIYVYPELTSITSDDINETISGRILVSQIEQIGSALLRGDDQFGKSSLLYMLYQAYLGAGYTPLLMTGKDIAGVNEEQFQRRLLVAVAAQYGKNSSVIYGQLDQNKKILLIDDLDYQGLNSETVARAVEHISRHFQHIILTVSDRFDALEATSSRLIEAVNTYQQYRFNGFGFKLRGDLITRWLSLGQTYSESELHEKVHSAEKTIDAVIGKGLVPTTAFNTLILLQSMEVSSKGGLANAGMAQYYEFLIRRTLLDAKLKAEQFDEVFNYISWLAWYFTSRKMRSIDMGELTQFNIHYSNTVWETDLLSRLDFLVRCKILQVMGTSYSFRYPYIKYFFAAKYVADNLDEQNGLRDFVTHACRHLYLRENANIVLFLTHHTASKWIIREIEKTLKQLLAGINPLDIIADTKLINGWVTQQARLIVDTTDIEKNRKQQKSEADRAARRVETEPPDELDSVLDLDFSSQINLLFKTCEILGQVLKNRYGSLEKSFKYELMKELFDGPLRGINFFLQVVNEHPEALLKEISNRFIEKSPSMSSEDSDRLAQRLVFTIMGAMSEGLLARQGEILGAPTLASTADQICRESDNVTYKLVAVAGQLSYPGGVPFSAVESLSKTLKDNVFGYRLLQSVVHRHLYMFSLPYDQRQRLADAAGVGVRQQSSIAFRSADEKKLSGRSRKPHARSLLGKLQQSFSARNKDVVDRVLEKANEASSQKEKKKL